MGCTPLYIRHSGRQAGMGSCIVQFRSYLKLHFVEGGPTRIQRTYLSTSEYRILYVGKCVPGSEGTATKLDIPRSRIKSCRSIVLKLARNGPHRRCNRLALIQLEPKSSGGKKNWRTGVRREAHRILFL